MSELLQVGADLSVLTSVVSSMLRMGLSLIVWPVTAVAAQTASGKVPVRAGH